MNSLTAILIEVEASRLEYTLWELAVNSYITSNMVFESVEPIIDTQFKRTSRASILLEYIEIDMPLVEGFAEFAADKWEVLKAFWKDTLESFIKIAEALKIEFSELKSLLLNKQFYDAFKKLSVGLLKSIGTMARAWANTYAKAQHFVFKNIKDSFVGKDMDEFAKFIDEKLQGDDKELWKKSIRFILGGAVVWISYEIWTKMFFIGNWKYDFDFSGAIGTMTGQVDFQSVLGAEFIPTLFWFAMGLIEKSMNLVFPCPPSCQWFGGQNTIAAIFVTGYILATNGSLAKMKESALGQKIQNYLKTIHRDNNDSNQSPNKIAVVKKGGLLKPI